MPTGSTPNARPALSLADLEAFDPHPQGRDPEKVYRCPICQGSERAFHLNTTTGVYNCKRASCGAKGKLTDFRQERPRQSREKRAQSVLKTAFSLAPREFAANVSESAIAREETAHAPATAAIWQTLFARAQPIGSTPDAQKYLARRGVPEAIASAADVRGLTLYGRGFAVFPFCDAAGAPVAFQARALDDRPDGHRAYGTKSAGVFLTCANALKTETVILCEAPIDALSLAVCGFPSLALGGCSAPDWLPPMLAFKRVLLAFDSDRNGAGDVAAVRLAPALQSFGARALRLAPLREAVGDKSDWNMMLQSHGAHALRAWLVARLAHIEHCTLNT